MAEDIRTMKSTKGKHEFEKDFEGADVIVLDSQYCSMGRMVALEACQISGYTYYDAVILLELVQDSGISINDVLAFEAKLRQDVVDYASIQKDPQYQRIQQTFQNAVTIAVQKGKCLIHDRATLAWLDALGVSYVRAFTYADNLENMKQRAKLSPLYENVEDERLAQCMKEEDNVRRHLHNMSHQTAWGETKSYDIVLNTEFLGKHTSATLLALLMR